MPIYQYECRECGHRFENLVLPTSPAAECPACRNKDLTQLISMFAVSSETTRGAHLSSARQKAAAVQKEKQHEEHKEMHEHFEDQRA
jgi:putative FmdB family regulatory protein